MHFLQVCSNGTRVYVHKNIAERFLNRLVEKTKNMKIGNPFDEDTVVGATISTQQAEKVLSYIDIAQKEVCIFILCIVYTHFFWRHICVKIQF